METQWKIWSNEHKGWWKPNSNGYTQSRDSAGLYSYKEAAEICAGANEFLGDGEEPHETMLPDNRYRLNNKTSNEN